MQRWVGLARTVLVRCYREARAEQVTFLAGSIAYHAFLSLLPFLLVLVLVLDAFASASLADRVVALVGGYLTPQTGDLLAATVRQASRNAQLTGVGFLALAWGMLKIFRSLDVAFSDVYESEAANSTADQLADGALVLVGFLTAIAIGAVVDSLALDVPGGAVGAVLAPVGVVGGLALAFFPIYYVFPDEDVTVREVLPGTLFAAVGWVASEAAFRHYAAFAAKSDTYGVVGVVLLLLTWLYVSGLVVLLGAILNAVLAGRSEDVAAIDWDGTLTADGGGDADGDRAAAGAAASAEATDGVIVGLEDALADVDDALADLDVPLIDDETADRDGTASTDDEAATLTLSVGDRTIRLPAPDDVETDSDRVQRPDVLGGDEHRGRLELRWRRED